MKRIAIVILMGLIVGVLLFASCGVPKSELEDPTYEEAVAFIEEDNTNEETSDYEFAVMITAENAAKQGIRGYWVTAQLQGGDSYDFIGFNTTDKGWIYFDATIDFEVKLVENEHYYSINNLSNPGISDTIVSLHYLPIP